MSKINDDIRHAASALRLTDANEAMTRFKLIDDILHRLLGWKQEDLTVEERAGEDGRIEFCDYLIKTGLHSIIVEAKRVGFNFDGMPKSRKALLRGTWLKKPVGEPVRQARDYARQKGVGFAVCTNGISWIIFPVNRRDQVAFEDSTALLFDDITALLDDEPNEFVGILGREAVIDGSLDKALLGSDIDQNEPRRLNNIYDRSFSKINRSSVFGLIERETIAAFSEGLLFDNPDLLEKCYVTTPARTRFDNRIRMYLTPKDPVLKTRPLRPVGKNARNVSRILEESTVGSRPIALLTLGLVGAGKTTFLNHTANVTGKSFFLRDTNNNRPHWIYIDFRNFSKSQAPRDHIIRGMFDYIAQDAFLKDGKRSVQPAYASDIAALREGPLSLLSDDTAINTRISDYILDEYSKKEPFVLKVLKKAVNTFPVFLVIDNVDQIEETEIQSNIFLEATAIARELKSNLILAMRDATYVKNRSAAAFNAFEFDAVYIDPPNILSVLARRFDVAENLMRGKAFEFVSDGGARVTVKDGKIIFQLLRQSVLDSEVGRIIEVAATGDTRMALQMTRQFMQYGYTSTARAVEIYQRTGRYMLPKHEALRAIILGNQNIYRDAFSEIGNPFDAYLGRSDIQLLRLFIMNAMVNFASERSFEGLSTIDISDSFERLGISSATTESVIRDLLKKRYLFSRSHQDFSREAMLIPSRLCGYITRDLVAKFTFLETMLFDTFISDDALWDALKENMRLIYAERGIVRKLGMRREAVIAFYEMLELKYEPLVAEARSKGLHLNWTANPFTRYKKEFLQNANNAIISARRNYGPEGELDILPLFDHVTEANAHAS